jgi:transcriptional regulator with XRE-family HTH domain
VAKTKSLSAKEIACIKKLGARVRAARIARGWTLEDAEENGWPSWQHLQQVETGEKNVNFTTLLRLLTFYKLDPNDVLGDLKLYERG